MKRVLVTGGSRGLGLAICERLLAEGWEVATVSRRRTEAVTRLGEKFGGRLRHWEADLADGEAMKRVVEEAGVVSPGLDAFVANAAVGTEGLLTLTSEEAIRRTIEINLTATILLTRQVVKGMLERGGRLVFVSSVAARTGFTGLTVYSATKGALVSFSRALAREYGRRGIRSNCVLPGFLETEMSATLGPEQKERLARRAALGRLGEVNDVVGAVAFLLSDEAAFITGTELVIDGGSTA
ncbi:MAG: SDR family oxidoreductase [Verrucomicrobia bacterium]|nr:MAG: SDR family oxidoreductase [Verrucomicrobiota bacterium]